MIERTRRQREALRRKAGLKSSVETSLDAAGKSARATWLLTAGPAHLPASPRHLHANFWRRSAVALAAGYRVVDLQGFSGRFAPTECSGPLQALPGHALPQLGIQQNVPHSPHHFSG